MSEDKKTVIVDLSYVSEAEKEREKKFLGMEETIDTTKEEIVHVSNNLQSQLDQIVVSGDSSVEAAQARVDESGKTYPTLKKRLDDKEQEVTAQLAQTKRNFIAPYFVEYFGSFNKYGLGEPEGIANYTEGNYVLSVKGSVGDKFLTVTAGNINHSGQTRRYPCVIRNDDLIFDLNQVIGTSDDQVLLLEPLQRTITNGVLGNLHDAVQGQHYTKLGYAAFIQHLYFTNPKHAERDSVIAQFLPYDTLGSWDITGVKGYNYQSNMKLSDDTFGQIGSSRLDVYATDATKDARWTVNLDGEKGYLETYVGGISGQALVEFYLDDALIKSVVVDKHVERLVFDYQNAKKGMLKISGVGPFPQRVAIGMTTWFKNKKFTDERLILPDDKVVCIGDSWFVNQAQESAKELENRMAIDGGSPTVLNFSKGGHTSTYARAWFDEYVIKNKPDKVIIEYFTNDFNSMGSTDVGTFINPEGQPQDMNIADMAEYVDNIQYMIDRAIEFGIQPIVVMPAATNSESQVSRFGNFTVQLWHGKKAINDTPIFKSITSDETTTRTLESNGESDLLIKSKAINSAARKGVIVDSDRNLTGGNIAEIQNNGVKKIGFKYDGSIEQTASKFIPQSSAFANNSNNRGSLYIVNSANTGNVDELRVVVQLADGTFVQKKVQLID